MQPPFSPGEPAMWGDTPVTVMDCWYVNRVLPGEDFYWNVDVCIDETGQIGYLNERFLKPVNTLAEHWD